MSGFAAEARGRIWRAELDEARLVGLAGALARCAPAGFVLYLSGELGAGKTTFARAFIRALAPDVRVKSPSFALIEPYRFDARELYHVDLYRVGDPSELEALALRELSRPDTGMLVEWPERARAALPPADLELSLEHAGTTRKLALIGLSGSGDQWMETVAASGRT